jgi:hypothetical protein
MEREVRRCTVQGPLAPWAPGFEDWLLERGYRPSAAFHRCCLLAVMSRWLERRGLAASELTEERAALFVEERRAAGLKTWAAEQSVRLPLVRTSTAQVTDGEALREPCSGRVTCRRRRSTPT